MLWTSAGDHIGMHWRCPMYGQQPRKHFTSACSIWKPYTEPCPTGCGSLRAWQSWLHQRNTSDTAVQEAIPHVSGQLDNAPGTTHAQEITLSCRHPVAPYPDVRYRMVYAPICVMSTDTGMGNILTGSVHNKVESQLPLFVSQVPDPSAVGVDALSMSWKAPWPYVYPPPALLPRVLEKTQRDQCQLILVATLWSRAMWFPLHLGVLVQSPIRITNNSRLLWTAGKLVDVEVWNWWCIKIEKQTEILIDKYYSCVKVIHKMVLDIYWVVVLVKVC